MWQVRFIFIRYNFDILYLIFFLAVVNDPPRHKPTPQIVQSDQQEYIQIDPRNLKIFKCDQCASTFTRKGNFTAHQKKHAGVRFPCTVCPSTFNDKSHLNRHLKNVHGMFIYIYLIRGVGV